VIYCSQCDQCDEDGGWCACPICMHVLFRIQRLELQNSDLK
jgi:hypothetical protein